MRHSIIQRMGEGFGQWDQQGIYAADSTVPMDHAVTLWQNLPEPTEPDPWAVEQSAPSEPYGLARHAYIAVAVHPLDDAFPAPEGTSDAATWAVKADLAAYRSRVLERVYGGAWVATDPETRTLSVVRETTPGATWLTWRVLSQSMNAGWTLER